MTNLFLNWNLGLGDAIICNGLVRWLVGMCGYHITIPALSRNMASVRFMFRDNPRIGIAEVLNDNGKNVLADNSEHVLLVGDSHPDWSKKEQGFDYEFYAQAGVNFDVRWDWFFVPRQRANEIHNGYTGYAFVHDDMDSGLLIKDPCLPVFRPAISSSIFDYYPVIMKATEIHCIDSAFACWIDSMPETGQKLYYHDIKPMADDRSRLTLRRNWIKV